MLCFELTGEADDHIKVRELYDSPSLTLDVSVIKPLWSQMDYDMIRMNFLDNLDTDEAMFPALRELETFGQFRVWEVREERFFGLPWDEGMPQQAVPHPPMYWADYWQDQGGSMGSYSYGSSSAFEEYTLVVKFGISLLDYAPDDWPFVGRDLIMIISNLFGEWKLELSLNSTCLTGLVYSIEISPD